MSFPGPPEANLTTWQAFEAVLADLDEEGRWIFRGVLTSWKEPLTSLERVGRAWSLPLDRLPDVEARLTRDFRRHPEGAQALGSLADNDIMYVWALMQHHGAPTRLMDWTYSPYVAAFFAFDELLRKRSVLTPEEIADLNDKAAVWAFNTTWLDEQLRSHLRRTSPAAYSAVLERKRDPRAFQELLTTPPFTPFMSTANPMVLNHRLSLQQGVFLCPGDITRSWRDNLDALGGSDAPSISRMFVLDVQPSDAFGRLHRMNVTARSLFPGLDGYGKFILDRARHVLEEPLSG
jgi:hypothetical protein